MSSRLSSPTLPLATVAFATCLLWIGAASAQIGAGPAQYPAPEATIGEASPDVGDRLLQVADWRRSTGVSESDGTLWGVGPGYRARFTDAGMELTPSLGAEADRIYPLRLDLLGYGRGTEQHHATPAHPTPVGDHAVTYARGEAIERYDVGPDGVEQSFLFTSRPAGTGDLVVRLRVETDLVAEPTANPSAGLTFRAGELGGVGIGAVTGVDAAGHEVAGSMRLAGDVLELRLPASFVDGAAYPMVLDPLVTPIVEVAIFGTADDEDPDVAYDSTNQLYLVVWQRRFAIDDTDIVGQRVAASGALLGSNVQIRVTIGELSASPTVASVNLRNRFLVAWTEDNGILCKSVAASNGAISPEATVVAGVDTILAGCPDVGGEATLSDDEAIVVWVDLRLVPPFDRIIYATDVTIQADGTCSPDVFLTTIASGQVDFCPKISKSGGPTGRYLITWERRFGVNDSELRGAVVSRDLLLLDSFIQITANSTYEETPDNDGDGTRWLVAYASEATSGSGDRDIMVIPVEYDPSTVSASTSGPAVAVEDDNNDDEIEPSVGWLGSSVLIGYSDQFSIGGSNYDTYVKSVDPFTGLSCEGEFGLELDSSVDADLTAIATQLSGDSGTAGQGALIAWETTDAGESDVRAQRFTAEDGKAADLGGGCGSGGVAVATCAVVGNASFTHRLFGASPNAPAYLILSPEAVGIPCGTCTLYPDPFNGFVFAAGLTNGDGDAQVATAIPNDPTLDGVEFVEQWFVSRFPGACSAFGGDLSNALGVEID